jgi:hypothetical protein
VRCDTGDRLDYYLKTRETGERDDVQACQAGDFQKVESRVKEGDYKEVFHLISHTDPDQRIISRFQGSFQPVRYERFDGAAVVVYKVDRQHQQASLHQSLLTYRNPSLPTTSRDKNDPELRVDRAERRP